MNFDLNTFRQIVIDWATFRNGTFKYNWVVKGGWEGWVQVDLVAYILSRNSTYDILREQPVYINPAKRTDLLLNANLVDSEDQIPVEIKAQSWNNRTEFLRGVEADINKLDDERNEYFSESDCVMFGIAFEKSAVDGMLAIQRGNHRIFEEIYSNTEVSICMATWTEDGSWG